MTVKELLSGPEKWTKGISKACREDGSYCYCLYGAIVEVYGESDSIFQKVRETIGTWFDDAPLNRTAYGYISTWNDAPERTYEEVMAAVEKAGI